MSNDNASTPLEAGTYYPVNLAPWDRSNASPIELIAAGDHYTLQNPAKPAERYFEVYFVRLLDSNKIYIVQITKHEQSKDGSGELWQSFIAVLPDNTSMCIKDASFLSGKLAEGSDITNVKGQLLQALDANVTQILESKNDACYLAHS